MTGSTPPGKPTVVVVGGGYGGIAVAKALDETSNVVLVEPKDAFMHNIAALRALVDPSWLSKIFIPYEGLLTNGRVVRDRAVVVDPHRVVTASGEEIPPTTSCWPAGRCIRSRPRRTSTTPTMPRSRSAGCIGAGAGQSGPPGRRRTGRHRARRRNTSRMAR